MEKLNNFYIEVKKVFWKYFPLSWQIHINRYLCKHYYKHVGNVPDYEINNIMGDIWESCETCGYAILLQEDPLKIQKQLTNTHDHD